MQLLYEEKGKASMFMSGVKVYDPMILFILLLPIIFYLCSWTSY